MKIKNYILKVNKNKICVDLETGNIVCGNDSIGLYDYRGVFEIDFQPDYVESFEIEEIIVDKLETKGQTFEFLSKFLMEDKELYKRIKDELMERKHQFMI